jgi:hypothetical protein
MKFFGNSFIYNNVPSELYDLRIISFDSGGKADYDSGIESDLQVDTIYRKSKANYYGRSHNKQLSFEFTVGSFNQISMDDQNLIKAWLLGSPNFTKLQIVQDDMSNIYYSAIITKATDIHVGNFSYALNLVVTCDSPWAWEEAKILNKNYTSGGVETDSFNFFNQSVDQDYNYPIIQFTTNAIGTSFSLTNVTDASRVFTFTGISANETITCDCYNKILTSSTGLYRLNTFNKHWFRLIQGNNSISLVGAINNFKMTYQFAKGG